MECAMNCSTISHQNDTESSPLLFSEVMSSPQVSLMFLFLLILLILTLVGNFLIVRTVFVTYRMRFAAFYFVASLAVADFLVGLLVLPVSMAYYVTFEMEGKWTFGLMTCDIWLFFNFWFLSASIFNLCLVSWDRYVAVTSPLHYTLRMSDERVRKMIIGNWSCSLIFAAGLIVGIHFSSNRIICTVKGTDPDLLGVAVTILFFLPGIFLVFVNGRVWVAVRRQKRRIGRDLTSMSIVSPQPSATSRGTADNVTMSLAKVPSKRSLRRWMGRSKRRTIQQEIRTFRMFLAVIGVFLCCWTPFFSMMLAEAFRPVSGFILYLAIVLTYCNSAFNFLIYGIFSRNFRRAMLASISCNGCTPFKINVAPRCHVS